MKNLFLLENCGYTFELSDTGKVIVTRPANAPRNEYTEQLLKSLDKGAVIRLLQLRKEYPDVCADESTVSIADNVLFNTANRLKQLCNDGLIINFLIHYFPDSQTARVFMYRHTQK